ncbi:MAG TPA: hypothetical protein VM305_11685 [Candidatus Limnocylindrales bacterium]|nr:hypothetical protein [Candidatus Limnocylindrales bacterium]
MEGLLLLLLGVLMFGVGPIVAMLDVFMNDLWSDTGISLSGLIKGLLVLVVPLAWVAYFLLIRRRRPFA